ncbi:hypothetical protein [Gelidibacter salicanalis]|uniref:Uncharacterized protein n=1 Tax=Gelidibacter salicanalis TaxID=291193 RepID=A0A934NK44_9FLAO|nr:hypothetical protein [Gelidibacter salicanalis]MBJ7879242.1 hypothetical protein [Gelidibacter salicanalis]
MKKYIICLAITLAASGSSFSQEWMTSLDAAKRIALVQDKMLFMIWEEAALIPYPVILNDERGNEIVFENIFDHVEINQIIWEYFVPVKVSEHLYAELYDNIKDSRTSSYIRQFEDDNIKIMDINGMIINTSTSPEAYFNLTDFITAYALNTAYLKGELDNYSQRQDFNTAFRLASKYLDYAILVNQKIRKDIIQVATMYLDEADNYLLESAPHDKVHLARKSEFLRLSEHLLQDRPKKVLRALKKMDLSEIDETNTDLLAFLYYTSYLLKKDEKNAEQWKSKVSAINLKKSQLISNIHL